VSFFANSHQSGEFAIEQSEDDQIEQIHSPLSLDSWLQNLQITFLIAHKFGTYWKVCQKSLDIWLA
jgi:hypothetical protein